jgi:hypothetical protein
MTDHVIETEVLVVGSGPAHPGVVVRTAGEASASVGA